MSQASGWGRPGWAIATAAATFSFATALMNSSASSCEWTQKPTWRRSTSTIGSRWAVSSTPMAMR